MVPPRRRDRHARGNRGASRTDSFPLRDERARESALFSGLPNGYGIGEWLRTIGAKFALRHGIPMLIDTGLHYAHESDIRHCESSNFLRCSYDSDLLMLKQILAFGDDSGWLVDAHHGHHHAACTSTLAHKSPTLLRFLRPSLRIAVTASAVVADRTAAAERAVG
jgi:hypothetical protein